jgi:tRNA (adenine22-N1)-methyltransferase
MGGNLIRDILDAGKARLTGVQVLVLQPNVGEYVVRQWLSENHWYLQAETILEEEGRIYEVLCAVRKADAAAHITQLYALTHPCLPHQPEFWLYRMGPWLVTEQSPILIKKWQAECQKWQSVLEQLNHSETLEARAKQEEMDAHIRELEEILQCMQMAK